MHGYLFKLTKISQNYKFLILPLQKYFMENKKDDQD